MKSLLNLTASLCLLTLMLFTSCQKDSNSIDNPKALDQHSNDIQYCFDNPNNPYEYIGIQHNLGLDAIAASPDFGNLNIEEAHDIVFETVTTNLGVEGECPYGLIAEVYASAGSSEPLLDVATSLLGNGLISLQAYEDIIILKNIIDNSPNPQTFGEEVLNHENIILLNASYTTFELEVLLGGTAIARHSMCYWVSALVNTDNPWHPYMPNASNNTALNRGFWDFIKETAKKFVKKDVRGYKKTKEFLEGNPAIEVDPLIKTPVSVVGGAVSSFLPFL